ncbi:hypothetical protein GF337_20610 [candidate division KSB1 bacterium]|nr:hypothetical protein [candidate division KSB1 bacterium]
MRHNRLWIVILSAILFLYVVCFIYTLKYPDVARIGDAIEYIQQAKNISMHRTVYCGDLSGEKNFDLYTRRPPMYSLILAMGLLVFNNIQSVLTIQIILTFLNGFFIYAIAGYFNISIRWRLILTTIFLLYPSQIIFTNIMMSEVVLQSFLLCAFFLLLKFSKTAKIYYLIFYNLCMVAAVLTKPIFLYFWIPNIALHVWLYLRDRKKAILILPFILVLAISSWSYRNYQQTGVFHYSSIKNHNLLRYNIRGLLTSKYDAATAEQMITRINQNAMKKDSYAGQYEHIEKKSFSIILDNFLLYSVIHLKGTITFFIDPGRFDLFNFLQLDSEISMLELYQQHGFKSIFHVFEEIPFTLLMYLGFMTIVNLAFLLAFILFVCKPNESRIYKIFPITMILYVAILTGPIGASRFRLPVFPYLVLTLPVLIEPFIQRSKQNKKGIK